MEALKVRGVMERLAASALMQGRGDVGGVEVGDGGAQAEQLEEGDGDGSRRRSRRRR